MLDNKGTRAEGLDRGVDVRRRRRTGRARAWSETGGMPSGRARVIALGVV
jgi:hypothetical protein